MIKNIAKDKRTTIFEDLPIPKAVALLAIPTILSQIVTMLYNLADTYFIGQTNNPNMLAAVSICTPVFMVMVSIANLFGVGGSSVISRALGAGQTKKAKMTSTICLYSALIVAIIMSFLAYFLIEPISLMLGASINTLAYAKEYLLWTVVIGAVPTVMGATMGIIIRSDGNATHAGIGIAIGGVLNIILDPIFIFTLDMGVKGAAMATMIANVVTVIYFCIYLIVFRHRTIISLNPKLNSDALKQVLPVLAIGAPAALNALLVSFSAAFLNNKVSVYGDIAIAALGVVKKIDLIPWSLIFGLTQGILPLIGYNYAAKNYARMRGVLRFALYISIIINIICLAIFEIFAPQVVSVFIKKQEVVTLGALVLRIFCTSVPFMSIGYMLNTTFQALGKASRALFLSIWRQGIVFLPTVLLMNYLAGFNGLLWAQTISDFSFALTAGILFIAFFKKLKPLSNNNDMAKTPL